MIIKDRKQRIIFSVALIAGVCAAFMLYLASTKENSFAKTDIKAQYANVLKSVQRNFEKGGKTTKKLQIKDRQILAKSAIIYDAKHNEAIYEKNADTPLPLASITKIFLVPVSMGYLGKDYIIEIKKEDIETEGDSGLKESKWRLSKLLKFMLINSSNDAAHAISRTLEEKSGKKISELLTEFARKHGLKSASFLNGTGLDESNNLAGSYASAKDVAKIAIYLSEKYPEIFYYSTKAKLKFYDIYGNEYKAVNTDRIIEHIFNADLSKTGFTDLAGGNLVIVFEIEPSHKVAIVALSSSRQGRFVDVKYMYDKYIKSLY